MSPQNPATSHPDASDDDIPFRLARHECLHWTTPDCLDRSRHQSEFERLEFLGKGAFGSAHLVKNRVDAQLYCLKSIRASVQEPEKILREVKVLSRLNNPNVVRYFAGWVEKGEEKDFVGDDEDDDELGAWTRTTFSDEEEFQKADPKCDRCQVAYKDWEVGMEKWGLIDSVLQPLDLCISCYLESLPPDVDHSKIDIRQRKPLADFLFILMEYCESTLSDAVQTATEAQVWNYFCQLVEGVSYLHSKGVIHRDLKPANIFVHGGVVKIGDLGLATIIKNSSSLSNGTRTNPSHHVDQARMELRSSGVGTFLYTAPEVATGVYDESCDVYSLGVILVEIFRSFDTQMERVQVLAKIQQSLRDPSCSWNDSHPLQIELATQMTESRPESRPSACQTLGELMSRGIHKPERIDHLVSDLSKRVVQLQQDLEAKNRESERLQSLLQQHNIPY